MRIFVQNSVSIVIYFSRRTSSTRAKKVIFIGRENIVNKNNSIVSAFLVSNKLPNPILGFHTQTKQNGSFKSLRNLISSHSFNVFCMTLRAVLGSFVVFKIVGICIASNELNYYYKQRDYKKRWKGERFETPKCDYRHGMPIRCLMGNLQIGLQFAANKQIMKMT